MPKKREFVPLFEFRLKDGKIVNLDNLDMNILIALHYLGEGTAYSLEKVIGHPKGTISNRLRRLVENGLLRALK